MTGNLEKWALVGNGSQTKKVEAETFLQTLGDVTEKALVYTLTVTIPCTGGEAVHTPA